MTFNSFANGLPAIASSTTAGISAYSQVGLIVGGVLLGIFVVEVIVHAISPVAADDGIIDG